LLFDIEMPIRTVGEYLNRDFKTELRTADRAASKKALLSKAKTFLERLANPWNE
jgi:hypothetical protein